MIQVSRQVLERLYLAVNLKEVMHAFNYRESLATRWDNIQNKYVESEIKQIDMKTSDWNAKEIT